MNGVAVDFYVSPNGYDKPTSIMPCAPFLMRPVEDDDSGRSKSLMQTKVEDQLMTFSGAKLFGTIGELALFFGC